MHAILIDDQETVTMKCAIEENGDPDHNIVEVNRVSKGRLGSIVIQVQHTVSEGNLMH